MKSIKTILSITLLIVGSFSLYAQEKHPSKSNNYIVLTRNIQQLKPIILAAQSLSIEDENNFGEFEVIVCGKTIKELENESLMEPYLTMAEEHNVTLIACGFSIKKFEVNKSKLSPKIKVVDNGILHIFQQQKKGYFSIEL